MLTFQEQRFLPHLVVARLSPHVKRQVAVPLDWQAVDDHYGRASSQSNF